MLSRPPAIPTVAVLSVTALTAVCFFFGANDIAGIGSTGRSVDFNTLGYVLGCFAAIFTLYMFLVSDNKSRATLLYADWRPIGARSLVGWLTAASWMLGAFHLWFWSLDLTRP